MVTQGRRVRQQSSYRQPGRSTLNTVAAVSQGLGWLPARHVGCPSSGIELTAAKLAAKMNGSLVQAEVRTHADGHFCESTF
jgi:hypothetical protein